MNITIKEGRAYNDKGEVGVLVSHGFGAGWSTWSNDVDPFDPYMIKAFYEGRQQFLAEADTRYPSAYKGGLDEGEICVEWLPKGTRFYIDEYDGSENIVTIEDLELVA